LISTYACEEPKFENATLSIRLTDAPANYERVMIDVIGIEIYFDSNSLSGQWVSLNGVRTGIYNLLDHQNGKFIPLATTEITVGKIAQIRLILGNNNSLVTPDGTYNLTIPSSQTSGLKVSILDEITPTFDKIIYLDFDVNKSIVQGGNGEYELHPVIRAYSKDLTGGIEGTISPTESNPTVSVNVNTETYETIVEPDGYFCIQGIPDGTYSINILPEISYIENVVQNIEVTKDSRTNIGTVVLEKKGDADLVAGTLDGDLNIEPDTSPENRFSMQTSNGQIDIDDITSGGDSYTYAGDATEIKVMPKAQGATVKIDGKNIEFDKSTRYTLTSNDAAMTVNLRNVKNGNGHWWISITGANITISPNPNPAK